MAQSPGIHTSPVLWNTFLALHYDRLILRATEIINSPFNGLSFPCKARKSGQTIIRVTKQSLETPTNFYKGLFQGPKRRLTVLSWVTFSFKAQRSGQTITMVTKQYLNSPGNFYDWLVSKTTDKLNWAFRWVSFPFKAWRSGQSITRVIKYSLTLQEPPY